MAMSVASAMTMTSTVVRASAVTMASSMSRSSAVVRATAIVGIDTGGDEAAYGECEQGCDGGFFIGLLVDIARKAALVSRANIRTMLDEILFIEKRQNDP